MPRAIDYSLLYETTITFELGRKMTEYYMIEEGTVSRGGWCNCILAVIEKTDVDGNTTRYNASIPEDVEQCPTLLTSGRGRLLSSRVVDGMKWHRLRLYDYGHDALLVHFEPLAQEYESLANHIRVDHREPENLIWFYEITGDRWIVEFGEDNNTHMRSENFPSEAIPEILGEYTMLHETARGADDPRDP